MCPSGLLQDIWVFVFKILRTEMFEPAEFTCFSEERLCRREFLSCGAYRLCRIFCSVTLVYPQFIYVTESCVSQINEFQIMKVVLSLLARIYYWPEESRNVLSKTKGNNDYRICFQFCLQVTYEPFLVLSQE